MNDIDASVLTDDRETAEKIIQAKKDIRYRELAVELVKTYLELKGVSSGFKYLLKMYSHMYQTILHGAISMQDLEEFKDG